MPRASYIYLISPKGETLPVAAFTVKYEAHNWVRRSCMTFDQLELTRMKDGGDGTIVSSRTLVPWELTNAEKAQINQTYEYPETD